MSSWRLPLAISFAALALAIAVRGLFGADPARRGLDLFPDMGASLAGESFARSPVLPGGTVQQPVVPGVIVRGQELFPYAATEEDAIRAGLELQNPWAAADAARLEAARTRGAQRFAIFCAACHGSDGEGRGPAVERGALPPPSLLAERARQLPDGRLYHVLTRGQGNMADYAAQLAPEDRWKVILHVRALQAGAVR